MAQSIVNDINSTLWGTRAYEIKRRYSMLTRYSFSQGEWEGDFSREKEKELSDERGEANQWTRGVVSVGSFDELLCLAGLNSKRTELEMILQNDTKWRGGQLIQLQRV